MIAQFPALFIISTSIHRQATRSLLPGLCHIKVQTSRVRLPWLDQVRGSEECAQYNANAADNDIRDAEEWVAATHDCSG